MKTYDEYKPNTFIQQLKEEDIPFFELVWINLLDYKETNSLNFDMLTKYKAIMNLPGFKNFKFEDSRYKSTLETVVYTLPIRQIISTLFKIKDEKKINRDKNVKLLKYLLDMQKDLDKYKETINTMIKYITQELENENE